MKKARKIFSIILAMTIVFAVFPLSLNSAIAADKYSGWFYDQLTDTEKVFYEAIASLDLTSGTGMVDLTDSSATGRALTQEQLERYVSGNSILNLEYNNACAAFEHENPDLFYVDYSALTFRVGRNSSGKYLAYLCSGSNPDYYRFDDFSSKATVDAAMAALNSRANEIANAALEITGATDEETVVERIRYVHNEIIGGSRYVYPEAAQGGETVFTAYGCLVLGESVCEGYSKATKLILNKIGIDCELIIGLGKEVDDLTASSQLQSHMWNAVKVGSNWYALDVTWDDPISVKRTTVNGVSTPVTDANGNYVYNDLCREKYFLLGSDTFYKDHTESKKLNELGREFIMPEICEFAYGVAPDASGLVVEKLSLVELKRLYDAGILSAYQYSLYASYANIKETKYVVKYGTTDTTISYNENSIVGTVVTHTSQDGVVTTYTVEAIDTINITTDDGQGNVTDKDIFGFMDVVVNPHFTQYSVPYYDITITEIIDDRNPYFAVSYNNMNQVDLKEHGMYLVYASDYLDLNTGKLSQSKWVPFNFADGLSWATDIPGKTIVVGNGDGNYFAVADFYPAMLDKETTNFVPLALGSSMYTDLLVYNQLTDWLNTDGTLNTDIFIAASPAHKGNGTIYVQPFVRTSTPLQSAVTFPGKTYDVRIEYDEPLKLENPDVEPTYHLSVSTLAEFYEATALSYTTITDFSWDGEKVISFKFTPSPMYNDNNCSYNFTFPGLVGRFTNLPPRYYSILVEKPATGLSACPSCPPSSAFFSMGTPLLIQDENLDNITYYDGSKVTDNAKFGLTLIASKPDEVTAGLMEDSVEEALGKEVLASSTYNIKLNLRNCQTPLVRPGQKVTIGLPYPIGYGPENEGVVFKAYHYKISEAGEYIAEELECYIGQYGLIVYVDSFSPFAVVVLEKDAAAPQSKSVYAVSNAGGSVSSPGIKTYAPTDAISYTFTPNTDYVLESVLVNGTEKIASVIGGVLTLDYEQLPDSTQISAVFTAASVVQAEAELDFTPEFVEVLPHVVSDWVTVYESCLNPGYRYTYCLSCSEHEEIERKNDVPALGAHTFGEWAAAPADDSIEIRSCSVCQVTEQRAAVVETTTEEPTTEKPTTEEPTTEKPTTEEPTTGEPTTEQPEQPQADKGFFKVLLDFLRDIIEWFRNLFS